MSKTESLKARVEAANLSLPAALRKPPGLYLINDLYTALQEAEMAGDKFCSSDCMNKCYNYAGAREDSKHFEALLKEAETEISNLKQRV